MMTTAVIVDDSKEARQNLLEDLEMYCPNVEVLAEAEGVVSGVKCIKKHQPNIVFLDIQMQDGSGFDLLEIIDQINFKIIFTTASDQYAVRAFKFSAVDYLMKPIDPDELQVSVKRAFQQPSVKGQFDLLKENLKQPKKIALNTLEKIQIVTIGDILRCESNVNYTMFHFIDGTRLMVTKTLKEYDKLLAEFGFIRVHQSHLINVDLIKEFVKLDGGYITMKDGSKVPVSTRKRTVVMEMISNL